MELISGKIDKAKKATIYGPEGIGKSSLAGQFPKPVFIDTEGSTAEMDVDRLPNPSSWQMLKEQVEWVKQRPDQFKTLVIDTIDWAEMMCVESVCAKYQKKGIEDFGYGQGYIYVKEEFGRFLNLLSDVIEAGIHIVLVAHSQIIKFEQPDEMGAYDRYQLKLGKKTSSQTAPLVKEWSDMVLFINYKTYSVAADQQGRKNKAQGGMRTIYATHHPAWDAKNRQGLPDEFPLDYSQIAHIFDKEPAGAQPAQTPSAPETPKTEAPETPPATSSEPQGQQESQEPAQLDPNIPSELRDLMEQYQVSEEEIKIVVGNKGYYPMHTPITNYDPDFIQGVLVSAWDQVHGMIKQTREEMPFK